MNLHEFYIGKAFDAYEYFGAHLTKNGVLFRVYAPNAEKIEVIGEFNDWDGTEDEMIQDAQSGVFECVQKDAKPGMMYKYRIYQPDGIVMDRFDPCYVSIINQGVHLLAYFLRTDENRCFLV